MIYNVAKLAYLHKVKTVYVNANYFNVLAKVDKNYTLSQ